jgi:hypothetical protein
MGPFERIKKLEFYYNQEPVQWQLQKSECFSFIRCNHPLFILRFGHSNLIISCLENFFNDLLESDDDTDFFRALQESAETYPLNDLQ